MAHQGKQLQAAVSTYKSKVSGFAKAIGKSRQQVYDYFKMETLDSDLRAKAADTLGIQVDTLFTVSDTKKPASSDVGGIVPDPQMPGIYQDIVRQLIRSSEAQIRISEALLEERQLIRDTAQAAIDLAGKAGGVAREETVAIQKGLNRLQHEVEITSESLESLEHLVVYGLAEALKKTPEEIELRLHTAGVDASSKGSDRKKRVDN